MPDIDVPLLSDGRPDLEKFTGNPALVQIKNLIDGLRGSVSEANSRRDEAQTQLATYSKLGTPEQITSWKTAAVDGSAIQTELEGYRALGKVDELKGKLEEATKNAETLTGFRRAEIASKAATLSGYNAERLSELVRLKGLDLEVKEGIIEKDGKPEKGQIPHVKKSETESVPLSDYVKSDLSSFADWLADTTAKPTTPTGGTKVVPQPKGGDKGGADNEALATLEKRIGGGSSTPAQAAAPRFDPLAPTAAQTTVPNASPGGNKT